MSILVRLKLKFCQRSEEILSVILFSTLRVYYHENKEVEFTLKELKFHECCDFFAQISSFEKLLGSYS